MKNTTPLIDRGLAVRAQIKQLSDELKSINDQLEEIALAGEQIPLEEPDRPGKQYLAHGTGIIVPVVFEADQLMGSLPVEGDLVDAIRDTIPAGGAENRDLFHRFFRPKLERAFDDSLRFRREAFSQFGPEAGAKFIHACIARNKEGIPRSRTVIAWDRARSAE